MKKVSILIPCYNEEVSMPFVFRQLDKIVADYPNYEWEVLCVNDGSRDNTLEVIKSFRVERPYLKYVDLSRNFGKEIAMMAGIDVVDADCLIIMDADMQDPPSLIPEMLNWWELGFEDIAAKRNAWPESSYMKKVSAFLFSKLLNKISIVPIPGNVGDFRLLDRVCVDALKLVRDKNRYTKGLFSWIGYKKKIVYYDRIPRVAGKSKWGFFELLNLALDAITSFSIQPLRLSFYLGLMSVLFSICYVLFVFVFGDNSLSTNQLILIVGFFIGGAQLISIGILGEYIGRLFFEIKPRPAYLIREKLY